MLWQLNVSRVTKENTRRKAGPSVNSAQLVLFPMLLQEAAHPAPRGLTRTLAAASVVYAVQLDGYRGPVMMNALLSKMTSSPQYVSCATVILRICQYRSPRKVAEEILQPGLHRAHLNLTQV